MSDNKILTEEELLEVVKSQLWIYLSVQVDDRYDTGYVDGMSDAFMILSKVIGHELYGEMEDSVLEIMNKVQDINKTMDGNKH